MPFDSDTKTRMFIRCGRLCCLCLKQCGTNIEAAHIVAEADKGSDEEDNGIPLCLDCHQEIGAYDTAHPRGNKFRPAELIARRDRIYRLVESGALYAQIVASQMRRGSDKPTDDQIDRVMDRAEPPGEVKRLAELLLSDHPPDAPDRKLKLLSSASRAYIIDLLISKAPDTPAAIRSFAGAATLNLLAPADLRVAVEQIVRSITLMGTVQAKAALLDTIPDELLAATDKELRLALFDDIVHVVRRDRFDEVNTLVPLLAGHFASIPPEIYADFVLALLDQAGSHSFDGAPAARRALDSLPDDMISAAIPKVDLNALRWHRDEAVLKRFAARCGGLAKGKQAEMFSDFVSMGRREFMTKYDPEWR